MSFLLPPWWFGVLVLGTLALAIRQRPWRWPVLTINLSHRSVPIPHTWRSRTAWLPSVFIGFGVMVLLVAMARPVAFDRVTPAPVRGIAIQFVLDRSGSMRQDDYHIGGERVSRLRAVTEQAIRFLVNESGLIRRPGDLVGLVSFARFPKVTSTLTLDHERVIAELDSLRTAADFRDDGSAVGDALALAVAELDAMKANRRSGSGQQDAPEGAVVLLTDGQQNAGEIGLFDAFRLAASQNHRVHVISLMPGQLSSRSARQRQAAAHDRLRDWAERTGGSFQTAGDSQQLRNVFQRIGELEPVETGQAPLRIARHHAINGFRWAGYWWPPLAAVALISLAIGTSLRWVVYPTTTTGAQQ